MADATVGHLIGRHIGSHIGVLGATSLVGHRLLPMLAKTGTPVTAFSRRNENPRRVVTPSAGSVAWRQLGSGKMVGLGGDAVGPDSAGHATGTSAGDSAGAGDSDGDGDSFDCNVISDWICLAPVWVLPDYFELLMAYGARRVVALSSTSVFAKQSSADPQELATVQKLVQAEQQVRAWAQSHGVQWVILRPTLIYGGGQDKNISEIARFIRRFGFFPVFGNACGQRQPIHAADVASACLAALQSPGAVNHTYNISGGETLPYCAMVTRVFEALGRRPHLLRVPLWAFRLAVAVLRQVPRYRQWSATMAERMCRDQAFDHADAARDLGFKPRAFLLTAEDLPA